MTRRHYVPMLAAFAATAAIAFANGIIIIGG